MEQANQTKGVLPKRAGALIGVDDPVVDDRRIMTETAKSLVGDYDRDAPIRSADAAMLRYRRGAERLIRMIRSGAKSKGDVVWKNTCDLLIAGKARLYVLSPRHDSEQLVAERTGNPDASIRAYFGGDAALVLVTDTSSPPTPNYSQYRLLREEDHGRASPGKVTIIDPWAVRAGEENDLRKELIHEVQHIVSHRKPVSSSDIYKEEFTAYGVSGFVGNESGSPVILGDGTEIKGLDNPRQFAIFKHLYDNYPAVSRDMNSKAAAVFSKMWGKKTLWEVVQEFAEPSGINLINSPRIYDLYVALAKNPPDMRSAHHAMHALDDEDKAAIRGQERSWREVFQAHPGETGVIAAELFPK